MSDDGKRPDLKEISEQMEADRKRKSREDAVITSIVWAIRFSARAACLRARRPELFYGRMR